MAKILVIDRKHYFRGFVKLIRKDDWELDAQLIDRVREEDDVPVNLTGAEIEAFFPADDATADPVEGEVEILDAVSGMIRITLAASGDPGTEDVLLAPDGVSMYITLSNTHGLQTVETPDLALEVKDREFQQF